MNLTTEITEAIQRNLPQQVGSELKKLLTQAEQNERMLESLRIECAEKGELARELENQVDQLTSELKEAEARAATAEQLEQMMRDHKTLKLEICLNAQKEISDHLREVNLALTGNYKHWQRGLVDPDKD